MPSRSGCALSCARRRRRAATMTDRAPGGQRGDWRGRRLCAMCVAAAAKRRSWHRATFGGEQVLAGSRRAWSAGPRSCAQTAARVRFRWPRSLRSARRHRRRSASAGRRAAWPGREGAFPARRGPCEAGWRRATSHAASLAPDRRRPVGTCPAGRRPRTRARAVSCPPRAARRRGARARCRPGAGRHRSREGEGRRGPTGP